MKRLFFGVAASLAAALSAQPASADITRAVYFGTFDLYDETGYMGFETGYFQKNGSITFLFDSDTAGSAYDTTTRLGFPGGYSNLSGSGAFSPGKGYVTIGSFSSGFIGQPSAVGYVNSNFYKSDAPMADYVQQSVSHSYYDGTGDYSNRSINMDLSSNTDFFTGFDPDLPLTYTGNEPYYYGTFNLRQDDPANKFYVYGQFKVASLTITNLSGATLRSFGDVSSQAVGSVPEPSTWAMMLLGIGAAGAALRRRRGMSGVGGQPATA